VALSISQRYESRIALLENARDALWTGLREAVEGLPHIDRVDFRVKGTKSFTRKVKTKRYSNPWVEIEDQISGRVLVFFLQDIELVAEAVGERWTQVEDTFKRPLADAEFGYESHHQVFVIPEHVKPSGWDTQADMPNTFELQIRTLFMHAYAEPQHEFGYRSASDLTPLVRRKLAWIAASAWGADQAYEDARQEAGKLLRMP